MSTKTDILDVIERNTKATIEAIQSTIRGDDESDNQTLKSIQLSLERVISTVGVLRKYRKLRTRAIYLWDTAKDEFTEATRSQRMKIARNLLYQETEGKRG